MFHTTRNDVTKTPVSVTESDAAKADTGLAARTKDTGRVRIGGGSIRFDDTKDAGRVHVGGGSMPF